MLRSLVTPRLSSLARVTPFAVALLLLPALAACSSSPDESSEDDSSRAVATAPSAGAFPLSDTLWGGPILRDEILTSLYYTDETLFVTTESGSLWAISKDGLPIWSSRQLPEPPEFPPVSNGSVVAVVSKGDLYCFDRRGGNLRLKKRLPFAPATRPALSSATGYFPSWDNDRVHSVDLTTGSIGWFFRPRGPVTAAPTVAGAAPRQVLYVASEDGAVTATDAAPADGAPGRETWSERTNGANRATLSTTPDGAILLVASEDTFLYGFDRASGQKRWSFGAQTPLRKGAIAVADAVYIDTGKEFVSLDSGDGSVRWRVPGSHRFLVRNGSQVYALVDTNQVVAIDDASGKVLGRYDMSAYAFFATNPDGDALYAATREGQIFALGRKML